MIDDEIDLESTFLKAFGIMALIILSVVGFGILHCILYIFDISMQFSKRDIPPLAAMLVWSLSNIPFSLKKIW